MVGVANLWDVASSLYSYNMGRFQFDSNQAQNSEFQQIHMRIARWSQYREDVRDVFQLTCDALGKYMVIGSLILGATVYDFKQFYVQFPVHPIWIRRFWGACVYEAMAYAVLTIWFSIHGGVLAQTSCVKALTRGIRIPFPSRSELEGSQRRIEQYESDLHSSTQVPWLQGARSDERPSHGTAKVTGEEEAVFATLMHDDSNGGSGESAKATSSHIKFLKQVHKGHASFDAYARVSLSISVQKLLTSLFYRIAGYTIVSRHVNTFSTVSSAAAICLLIIILYKLDLYIPSRRIRVLIVMTCCGPSFIVIAVALWFYEKDSSIPVSFNLDVIGLGEVSVSSTVAVVLAALAHACGSIVVLVESFPSGVLHLPSSWRLSQYLDIFGWNNGGSEEDMISAGARQQRCRQPSFGRSNSIELSSVGGSEDMSTHSSPFTSAPADSVVQERVVSRSSSSSVPGRSKMSPKSSALPWKYFSYLTYFQLSNWIATIGWVVFWVPNGCTDPGLINIEAQALSLQWPRRLSSPIALGCSESLIVLTDGSDFYVSEMISSRRMSKQAHGSVLQPDAPSSGLRLLKVALPKNALISLAGFTSSRNASFVVGKRVLLFLENGGRSVFEVPFPSDGLSGDAAPSASSASSSSVGREKSLRWTVSPSLGTTLRAIAAVWDDSACHSSAAGKDESSPGLQPSVAGFAGIFWSGVYGATDSGDVILLCRKDANAASATGRVELQPRHVVVPAWSFGRRVHEFIGMHDDGAGMLWILALVSDLGANETDKRAELSAWIIADGLRNGSWAIRQQGHQWISGICGLLNGEGVLAAAKLQNFANVAGVSAGSGGVSLDSGSRCRSALWRLRV
eukprot:TRINITY_DN37698_c0_g1_i1.p1 TRINITY_DN37698_c0_g1~~TRINITY_DN37698_c0_g1_i1.p1  ORF type:complete len:851 (+),score=83.22 TRINITY_DN37698_c0_g1_i1:337-2889(+)